MKSQMCCWLILTLMVTSGCYTLPASEVSKYTPDTIKTGVEERNKLIAQFKREFEGTCLTRDITLICMSRISNVTPTGFYVKFLLISAKEFFMFSKRTEISSISVMGTHSLTQEDNADQLIIQGKDKFLRIYGLLETIYHTYSFTETLSP